VKTRALAVAFLLAAVSTAAAGCGGRHELRGDVLITSSRLFDGRHFESPGRLLVRGGKVLAVGPSLDATARRTIRHGDATILPGFVDLHVHTEAGMVEGGDTTVRNLGAPLAELRPPSRQLGPLVLMAGPLVSVSGGYPETVWGPSIALDVRSPADARSAARMLARRGAAVIKIALEPGHGAWPMLSVAEVRAIVAEAHAHGLRVTAHAMGAEGVRRALAGGVDELAHTPCGATPGQIGEILRRHLPFVATLHVEQLSDGGCLEVARKLVVGGDLPLYGTDVGNPGIPPGIDVRELQLMRAAGMTPTQVLAAATSRAGAELGRSPLGSLVAGAPADAVAVRGDARVLGNESTRLLVLSRGNVIVAP
jgi:imidazolonepropionase-like amidohydrolase